MKKMALAVWSIVSSLLVLHVLAQEPDDVLRKKPQSAPEDTLQKKPMTIDPKKADETEPPREKARRVEPLELPEDAKQEDPQEVLARVKKNMSAAEERLEKKDVSEKTREIQHDILRDLDALINRAEEQQSGGGKSKPSLGSNSKSGQTGSQSRSQKQKSSSSSQSTAANSGKQNGQQTGKKEEGTQQGKKGGDDQQARADDKKDEHGNAPQGKGKDVSGGGNSPEKKEVNTVADLFKEVWGHLPASKRMEMDAYSRERFMARYEDILREYYRTIAEKSRRGGK